MTRPLRLLLCHHYCNIYEGGSRISHVSRAEVRLSCCNLLGRIATDRGKKYRTNLATRSTPRLLASLSSSFSLSFSRRKSSQTERADLKARTDLLCMSRQSFCFRICCCHCHCHYHYHYPCLLLPASLFCSPEQRCGLCRRGGFSSRAPSCACV